MKFNPCRDKHLSGVTDVNICVFADVINRIIAVVLIVAADASGGCGGAGVLRNECCALMLLTYWVRERMALFVPSTQLLSQL